MELQRYHVWDRTIRWFHWINVICIVALAGMGLILLNGEQLGIEGEAKVSLKTLHAYFGYAFSINLIWRLIWAFVSPNRLTRWSAILPLGRGYFKGLYRYLAALGQGRHLPYRGHSPLGRAMVTVLLLLMLLQGGTGLVLAGTDLYLPPFGNTVAQWVAKVDESGVKATELKPGSMENVHADRYREMRQFRQPIVATHEIVFYFLVVAIAIHIAGVVWSELRERSGLISAMFSGDKVFSEKPVDDE